VPVFRFYFADTRLAILDFVRASQGGYDRRKGQAAVAHMALMADATQGLCLRDWAALFSAVLQRAISI